MAGTNKGGKKNGNKTAGKSTPKTTPNTTDKNAGGMRDRETNTNDPDTGMHGAAGREGAAGSRGTNKHVTDNAGMNSSTGSTVTAGRADLQGSLGGSQGNPDDYGRGEGGYGADSGYSEGGTRTGGNVAGGNSDRDRGLGAVADEESLKRSNASSGSSGSSPKPGSQR